MPYIDTARVRLFHADCREALRGLESNSLDSCVTDPPYELGFMGKGWDKAGVAFDPTTWAEVLRVLKPGAHLLAFGGTRTYHRMACAIEDSGFEIRDSLFPSPRPACGIGPPRPSPTRPTSPICCSPTPTRRG